MPVPRRTLGYYHIWTCNPCFYSIPRCLSQQGHLEEEARRLGAARAKVEALLTRLSSKPGGQQGASVAVAEGGMSIPPPSPEAVSEAEKLFYFRNSVHIW